MYRARTQPCTRLSTQPSTRPCKQPLWPFYGLHRVCTRVHDLHGRLHGRVRAVNTAEYTAVYGPYTPFSRPCRQRRTRPCMYNTARVHSRVHDPVNSRVHGLIMAVHGLIMAVYGACTRVNDRVHGCVQAVYSPCTR